MFDIVKISSHFWLKHQYEPHYHAYVKVHSGSKPLCNGSPPINNLQEMDLPGDLSPCCTKCTYALYLFPRPFFKVKNNELSSNS